MVEAKSEEDDRPTILILHTSDDTNPKQLIEKIHLKQDDDTVDLESFDYNIVTNYYTAQTRLKIFQLPVLDELILTDSQIKSVHDLFESSNV